MDVAQAVVASVAAALLELDLTRQQIEFVVRDQHLVRGDLEKARQRGHRLARQVHVGLRLQQPDGPLRRVRARHQTVIRPVGLQVTFRRRARSSMYQNPALWRVSSYSGPGLPRPTNSRIMMVADYGEGPTKEKPRQSGA
jgi:hypothetical protein